MKKLLLCSIVSLGLSLSLSIQAVNAAGASTADQKKIPVAKISCASKKIDFYYIDKNGEIVCLAKKAA